MKRVRNSAINAIFGIVSQILMTLLGFVSRKVFVLVLGFEVLGVNGLFTNIISMLSLTELGLGTAIIYSMYRPIAENDTNKVAALLQLYSKVYMAIAGVVTALGLCLLPILPVLAKSELPDSFVRIVFTLFLLNSAVSYLYSYKRSIIIAHQKNYVVTGINTGFQLFTTITQIVILLTSKNYILFLVINIFLTLICNVVISKKAESMFPFIKDKSKRSIDPKAKKEILVNTKALIFHRIGSFFVTGTDNLLLSSFVGVKIVGLLSNYTLITTTLNITLRQVFNGVTAGMGNLIAGKDKTSAYPVFKKLMFLNFWIYGFCAICFFTLASPFITLWLGEEALLSPGIVLLLSTNFYLMGMRASIDVMRESAGLYDPDKYMPLIESAINLVVSLVLLKFVGAVGVFIGTTVSTLCVPFWTQPLMVYNRVFRKNVSHYYTRYFKYGAAVIVTGVLTVYLCRWLFPVVSIGSFIGQIAVCAVVPNVAFFILFFFSKELHYFVALVYVTARKILKPRKHTK